MSLLSIFRRTRKVITSARPRTHLRLEALEDRVTPSTMINIDGMIAANGGNQVVPDSSGAIGPNSFISTVNDAIRIHSKNSESGAIDTKSASDFFGLSIGGTLSFGDPFVVYNEITQRFFIEFIYFDRSTISELNVAISTSNNPQTLTSNDWVFLDPFDVDDFEGPGYQFGDYPKVGYNADGYVVSLNISDDMDNHLHVTLLAIENDGTDDGFQVVPNFVGEVPTLHHSFGPASMHNASPGDPMWFVEAPGSSAISGESGDEINVIRMDDPFSNDPTFNYSAIGVTAYDSTVPAHQPGGRFSEDQGTRMNVSALRNVGGVTHLVATHQVGDGNGYNRVHREQAKAGRATTTSENVC